MPDRWGRPTFNDWMQITGAIQGFQQQAETRQNKENANKAIDYYQNNPDVAPGSGPAPQEGPGYTMDDQASVALNTPQPERSSEDIALEGVSPAARTKGYDTAVGTRQLAREDQQAQARQEAMGWANEGLAKAKDKRAWIRNQDPDSYSKALALSDVAGAYASSQEGQISVEKNAEAKAKQAFGVFRDRLSRVSSYLEQDNMQEAERLLQKSIDESHHPLYLKKQKDGKYTLEYREGGKRGKPYTGLSLEEAAKFAMEVTPNQFIPDYVAQAKQYQEFNRKSIQNPEMLTRGKKKYRASRIANWQNPQGDNWQVFDENGQRITEGGKKMFSTQELRKKGYKFPPSADQRKGALDLAAKRADIDYTQARAGKARQEAQGTALEQARDRLRNIEGVEMGGDKGEAGLSGTVDSGKFGTEDVEEIKRRLSEAADAEVVLQRNPRWFKDDFSFSLAPKSQGQGAIAPGGGQQAGSGPQETVDIDGKIYPVTQVGNEKFIEINGQAYKLPQKRQ